MQGIKIRPAGRIFALAASSKSHGFRNTRSRNARSRKTKEEHRVTIVAFVEKYKASNEGKFPTTTLTYKEVGGTYYTVREILEELKQENLSSDTMSTYLEDVETKNQTGHVIKPLSLPAESEKHGAIGNHNSLEHKETTCQETLSGTGEKKIVVHNDVLETCGNHQTQPNEGKKIVESPLGSYSTSLVVNSQPPQGLTEGQSISNVSNGAINSSHHLELSKALLDTEEQGNISHNNVKFFDPNDQTQAKQEIDVGERLLRTSTASDGRDEDASLKSTTGDISTASIGARDNNHSLALSEEEYLMILSDTKVQKTTVPDVVVRTFGRNDCTRGKKEIKIVEKPRGPKVSTVVCVQPLQEMMGGQSFSSVTGGFTDNNHALEIDETKHEENLSDIEEKKNMIQKDVETCGLNDQTQVKQEITIIEESPGRSAASISIVHKKGEEHIHLESLKSSSLSSDSHSTTCVTKQPQDLSFSRHHEDDHDLVRNSAKGIADKRSIPADKIISPLKNSFSASEETTETPENILNSNHISVINEAKHQEALSNMEEKKNIIHETCSLNDQTQGKKDIKVIEDLPGTSAASNPLVTLDYLEDGNEHLHWETSKPLSLSADSHSTTFVTNQPEDLSIAVQCEGDNDLVLNSTKVIAEESEFPADKLISSLSNSVTAPEEATEIPDNILKEKILTASNVSSDQVLIGVKAFDQVLLHRLALSALVIKTLIHAGDGSQKSSSESLSKNLDGFSHSKNCIYLSDEKENASVLSNLSLDEGESSHNAVQSTQKTNSDGFCANNSGKIISSYQEESTGDIMQISHDLSDGNSTPTLEDTERTYKSTTSSKDRDKLETNVVSDFVNNMLKGIVDLLKK